MEVVIIDSISHEWEGIGGILETHSNMTGNSYTNWSKLTPFYYWSNIRDGFHAGLQNNACFNHHKHTGGK